jgi:hypothetical protein
MRQCRMMFLLSCVRCDRHVAWRPWKTYLSSSALGGRPLENKHDSKSVYALLQLQHCCPEFVHNGA